MNEQIIKNSLFKYHDANSLYWSDSLLELNTKQKQIRKIKRKLEYLNTFFCT